MNWDSESETGDLSCLEWARAWGLIVMWGVWEKRRVVLECLLALIIAVLLLALYFAFWPTPIVSADGPEHHFRPDWVTKAERYELAGWRYYSPSERLLYGYGPIPVRGERAHFVVWFDRQFQTQFAPSKGLAYVVDQVLEHARQSYGTGRAAVLATKPLTRAQVFEYWRYGMVARLLPSVTTRLSGALAGPSGTGLLALPCGAWQKATGGLVRCEEAVRE